MIPASLFASHLPSSLDISIKNLVAAVSLHVEAIIQFRVKGG